MRSYEQVKNIFEENGCKLLETEYKNSSTKMRYIAQCGHEHSITLENFRAGKGRICRGCRYKQLADAKKYDYEYVKQYFKAHGCELIETEYKDANRTKMEYVAQCGHRNKVTFSKFVNGVGRVCNKCSKSIKYDYDEVFRAFEERGCTLLEDSYVNCKTQMRYIATCGHESTIRFDVFNNCDNASLKCPKCQSINHYTIDDVRQILKDNGCTLLSKEYRVAKDKVKYTAQCGHETAIRFQKFLAGHGRKCNKCCKPVGEEHWKFNPDLTAEDREARAYRNGEIRKCRNKAFKRDNFTCQICGDNTGGNLVAHHIDSWNSNIEKRFDLDNLITLCEKCHKSFHSEYGFGNNTKEQFNEFKKVMEIPRA